MKWRIVFARTVSVPSNISEGSERPGRAEFRQFLGYAKGSAGELRTQFVIAGELDYLPAEQCWRMVEECREISRMIWPRGEFKISKTEIGRNP